MIETLLKRSTTTMTWGNKLKLAPWTIMPLYYCSFSFSKVALTNPQLSCYTRPKICNVTHASIQPWWFMWLHKRRPCFSELYRGYTFPLENRPFADTYTSNSISAGLSMPYNRLQVITPAKLKNNLGMSKGISKLGSFYYWVRVL